MEVDPLLFGCEYMTQGKRTLTVAAKVPRVYSKNDLEWITRVGHWFYSQFLVCINGQLYFVEVLRGGHCTEGPLPSEHPLAIRCDGDHELICNGIGVDGER